MGFCTAYGYPTAWYRVSRRENRHIGMRMGIPSAYLRPPLAAAPPRRRRPAAAYPPHACPCAWRQLTRSWGAPPPHGGGNRRTANPHIQPARTATNPPHAGAPQLPSAAAMRHTAATYADIGTTPCGNGGSRTPTPHIHRPSGAADMPHGPPLYRIAAAGAVHYGWRPTGAPPIPRTKPTHGDCPAGRQLKRTAPPRHAQRTAAAGLWRRRGGCQNGRQNCQNDRLPK